MRSFDPGLSSSAVGDVSPVDPLLGQLLADRYRLFSLLGEGGMGRVYLGEHVLMRKRVAVKVLHRELTQMPEVVARFEREAMAAANIDHPNVAAATDFGKLGEGSVFLVLEFVQGKSLRDLIEEGPLLPERALYVARQITSALVTAHALGIVHRDLKPENVMLVDKGGDPDFVKVLDFGVAKVPVQEVSERGSIRPAKVITRVGMIFGTPEYMAPEQALGQNVDARADLFAVGVILFEMLCGKRPFSAENPVGILGQQLQGPLPTFAKRAPHVSVPTAVEQLVLRLLSPAAASRFQTAEELALAIDGYLARSAQMESGSRAALASVQLMRASRSSMELGDPALVSTSAEVLNASTLPAPQFEGQVTTRSRDTETHARRFPPTRPRVSRRKIWYSGGALAVTTVMVLGGWWHFRASKAASPVRPEPPSVHATAPEVLRPAPVASASDAALAAARAGGIDALRRLAREYPRDAKAWTELAKAQLAAGKASESVDSAKAAYAASATAGSDANLATVLWKASQRRESRDKTVQLLSSEFGERGPDILYDLTVTRGVRGDVKRAAVAALDTPDARKAASPALRAILQLQQAKSCEDKLAGLEQVQVDADARALPLLNSMRSSVGCGRGKRRDCYPCLRQGLQLENAIGAIAKRTGR